MKTIKQIIFTFLAVGLLLSIILLILFKFDLPIFVLVVAVIVLCAVAGWLISREFSQRLASFSDGVKIIRSGNLGYRINTYSKDGLGQISKEIDEVVAELEKKNRELDLAQVEIVEQKSEIELLREKEQHFRKLFEESNDAVFVYDFDGNIIDINNKACDMLGYPKAVILGLKFFDLQVEAEMTSSKAAFKTGSDACAIRYESRMRRANGEIIDVEISTSVVDMKKGQMQSIVSDISTRKNMQKAIEESEEKFRTFMETASDLMFITGALGELVYVNNAMAKSLGYLKEEIARLNILDLLSQDSIESYKTAQQVLKDKGEVSYETVWETKHRKKIFGDMTEVAIFDQTGELVGSRGIFRDISERKKVEASQRLSNLGKLAADVAHEVNNPITIILARAEMLQMQRKDDLDLQKKTAVIIEQCEMAISIVQRLLKFSKPSKKEFNLCDMNTIIKAVISLIEHQFQGLCIEIELALAEDLSKVNVDEKQIQEVLMNLLRNAGEAMPDGGKVKISTYEKAGQIYADLQDNGEGISEEIMKKIFDPFFTTKEKGTGLGLSVCYGIMKAHGGDLKYLSKQGEGTTARIVLPAGESEE